MQLVQCYERHGNIYLHASSETTNHMWVYEGCIAAVPKTDLQQLSLMVRKALDCSRTGVPHPRDLRMPEFNAFLELAGVKSWNTFAKSAKCVSVERTGNTVRLKPTRSEGVPYGYVDIEEKTRTVPDDETLGKALVDAFMDAEIPGNRR